MSAVNFLLLTKEIVFFSVIFYVYIGLEKFSFCSTRRDFHDFFSIKSIEGETYPVLFVVFPCLCVWTSACMKTLW